MSDLAAEGNGAITLLFNAGRFYCTVPEHYLQLFINPNSPCFIGFPEGLRRVRLVHLPVPVTFNLSQLAARQDKQSWLE
jgi:hypothetical protein